MIIFNQYSNQIDIRSKRVNTCNNLIENRIKIKENLKLITVWMSGNIWIKLENLITINNLIRNQSAYQANKINKLNILSVKYSINGRKIVEYLILVIMAVR